MFIPDPHPTKTSGSGYGSMDNNKHLYMYVTVLFICDFYNMDMYFLFIYADQGAKRIFCIYILIYITRWSFSIYLTYPCWKLLKRQKDTRLYSSDCYNFSYIRFILYFDVPEYEKENTIETRLNWNRKLKINFLPFWHNDHCELYVLRKYCVICLLL